MLHVLLGRGLLPRRRGRRGAGVAGGHGVAAAGEVGAVTPRYRLCTVHNQSDSIYTLSTHYLHTIYTVSTHYLHSIYTVSTSTQYLHSIYWLCTVHNQSVAAADSACAVTT